MPHAYSRCVDAPKGRGMLVIGSAGLASSYVDTMVDETQAYQLV